MIPLKSNDDLQQLRKSAAILAQIMRSLRESIEVGKTTSEIDKLAEDLVRKENALPAFKGYRGYPASICISINDEVVHGIPGERRLREGDIVSLDFGVNYNGFFSDAAFTVGIGRIHPRLRKLIEVTEDSLYDGIKKAYAGNHISDISHAIQDYVERHGFSVVRQFVGHGIGTQLHEEPEIPNFGIPHKGPVLKRGMVLAIEPMVNIGTWECKITNNSWTAVTSDGLVSAHFEHTIAITDSDPEILTK